MAKHLNHGAVVLQSRLPHNVTDFVSEKLDYR